MHILPLFCFSICKLSWFLNDTATKIFFIETKERNDAAASGLQMEQKSYDKHNVKTLAMIQQWETIYIDTRI